MLRYVVRIVGHVVELGALIAGIVALLIVVAKFFARDFPEATFWLVLYIAIVISRIERLVDPCHADDPVAEKADA